MFCSLLVVDGGRVNEQYKHCLQLEQVERAEGDAAPFGWVQDWMTAVRDWIEQTFPFVKPAEPAVAAAPTITDTPADSLNK